VQSAALPPALARSSWTPVTSPTRSFQFYVLLYFVCKQLPIYFLENAGSNDSQALCKAHLFALPSSSFLVNKKSWG